MRPADLDASAFAGYPALARTFAQAHVPLFRRLPLSFLGLLLTEVISYDWRFPVEREEISRQVNALESASAEKLSNLMSDFAQPALPDFLYSFAWAAQPAAFVEKLTAYLWTVHAVDAFHQAAVKYAAQLQAPEAKGVEAPRWCIVVVGQGAQQPYPGLFKRMRAHGTMFDGLDPTGGLETLLRFVQAREQNDPTSYAHWYIDGGTAAQWPKHGSEADRVAVVSYDQLAPVRSFVLQQMHTATRSGTVGPENLRSLMAQMRPADLPWGSANQDPVLQHFELSLLTEGSGTQIFSTSFVQWAAREVLRRAKPKTVLLRYAPRQVDRPMNDLLLTGAEPPAYDAEGSLVDADMGAYYTWVNLCRLPGADVARFLGWREGTREAIVVAPGMAKGASSSQQCSLQQLLQWMA